MNAFRETEGFRVKLWRGESMCLLGFDVDPPVEDDFVGFAVEYKEPGSTSFKRLHNRLSFDNPPEDRGFRTFPTTVAPLQMFRWVHIPWAQRTGTYTYRVTKMHMPADAPPVRGLSLDLDIELGPVTIPDFLDIGFTRNFASSQGFEALKERLGIDDDTAIIPTRADDGLAFAATKAEIAATGDVNLYEWLGFEASRLLFDFLDWAIDDDGVHLDVMAYDLNEPDIVGRLEALGERLRILIDDSTDTEDGVISGHGADDSAETQAAERLTATAGASRVKRGHFSKLQHNKVFIAKRADGTPIRLLGGSTNFSYRGLYIQSNNMFVFHNEAIAGLFEVMFEQAFTDMEGFKFADIAQDWHDVPNDAGVDLAVCFAPHTDSNVSLKRVGDAITDATSSVFYSVAFLNQIETGPVRDALDELIGRPLFSYGVANRTNGLEIVKPSGEIGLVDFAYLKDHAPEPFSTEWSGGGGINVHHKFVVADFDQPTATVFTGSCNFAPGGERGNGDHLIRIRDQRIATAYTIEALRVFDHLNFRNRMQEAGAPDELLLQKPTAISGAEEAWFERFYEPGSQRERDRKTFSHQ